MLPESSYKTARNYKAKLLVTEDSMREFMKTHTMGLYKICIYKTGQHPCITNMSQNCANTWRKLYIYRF